MSSVTAYRARWIVPVDARPIENGCIVVAQGRIVSVVSEWSQPTLDLGNVAVIPGLVNCHTHLEFSALTEPLAPLLPFTDWIKSVIRHRQLHPHEVPQAIHQGLQESLQSGVTLLGDIATTGWSWDDYSALHPLPRAVVFQELLGLTEPRVASQIERMDCGLKRTGSDLSAGFGLSPHATYSVHPDLFRTAIDHAARHSELLAVHLAETPSEVELLRSGRGEFREFLQSLGLWHEELFGSRTCRDWLEQLAELPRALVVHGNYLSDDEIGFLAANPQLTLVYCPRTHAMFQHTPHPWKFCLELGGSVALGTDSRASNPDLSLWKEMQFLAELHPEIAQHSLLKLGTTNGARALGHVRGSGTLTAGKRADLAVIALRSPGFVNPTYQILNPENQVIATMLGGCWAWTAPELGDLLSPSIQDR